MGTAAILRARVEGMLEARIPSALTPKLRPIQESMSCGINDIDRLEAFPRGTLAEICGQPSTGRTTLLYGLLARCTAGGEAAAIIDVTDTFDPVSASQAGVVLSELLWIRCGFTPTHGRILSSLEQALGAADLLLQSGGFGLLALDLGNVPEKAVRQISLTTWFRIRRGVEETQTLFVVLGKQSTAGTSSANVLDVSQSGIYIEENATSSKLQHIDGDCLIRTLRIRAEVLRGQMRKPVSSVRPVGEFSTSLQSFR
jgi:recombination protein RecA